MILSLYVNIKISNNLLKYYQNLGYNVNTHDYYDIPIKDLPNNSSHKILVECDICKKHKYISLNRYNTNTKNGNEKYACSRKCAEAKNIKTIQKRYNVNNISQIKEIKDKKIKTCLKNHNVEFPQQSIIIFNKSKKKKYDKYGSENYNNSKKRKITNIIKYGFSTASQSDECKKKSKLSQFESNKKLILEKYKNIDIVDYDINDKYILKCDNNCVHTFKIYYKLLWHRLKSKTLLCTVCNPINKNISGLEIQLTSFIKNNCINIITNSKDIIKPYELDIYLPDLNLAFEFNGVYWHNELNKEDDYHYKKTDLCLEKGIQLIHVWEDDWMYKQDIVKSMILNKLGKTINKIFARKTIIKEITDNKLIKEFLENNHLQGFVGSKIKIGLFYENDLVSLMTFGNLRKTMNSKSDNNQYEMLRFCNKLNTNVIGGASKLFNYFIKTYNPKQVISYADRSYSNGDLYEQLGFKLQDITAPNYYYVIDGIRKYRFGFRKDILIKEGYDPSKTEHEIMLERKIYRIYNSGNYKFIKK